MRGAPTVSNHDQTPNPEEAKQRKGTVLHEHDSTTGFSETPPAATAMEMMASSSAPTTSYYNVSVAQAVLTLSINAILVWLTTFIKKSSSASTTASSGSRRRDAVPAAAPAPPSPSSPAKPAAAADVDIDVVLGLMGAGAGAVSVGFEEAAALFEEEEATVEEAREAFAVFDRNGDGFIDAAELRSVLTSLGFQAGAADAECQRMIDAYDQDKDGRIDFQEFVNLMETTSH